MLTAVNFDRELSLATVEVDNIWADAELTIKSQSSQLSVSQKSPEISLGGRLISAQVPPSLLQIWVIVKILHIKSLSYWA